MLFIKYAQLIKEDEKTPSTKEIVTNGLSAALVTLVGGAIANKALNLYKNIRNQIGSNSGKRIVLKPNTGYNVVPGSGLPIPQGFKAIPDGLFGPIKKPFAFIPKNKLQLDIRPELTPTGPIVTELPKNELAIIPGKQISPSLELNNKVDINNIKSVFLEKYKNNPEMLKRFNIHEPLPRINANNILDIFKKDGFKFLKRLK